MIGRLRPECSGAEAEVAFGAADEGAEAGFVAALDGEVDAHAF